MCWAVVRTRANHQVIPWDCSQIFEYNGAAIVAMAGKECVAIGSDLRLGVQFQTLATDYKKVYCIHDKLYIGLAGLSTDAQTLCAHRCTSCSPVVLPDNLLRLLLCLSPLTDTLVSSHMLRAWPCCNRVCCASHHFTCSDLALLCLWLLRVLTVHMR